MLNFVLNETTKTTVEINDDLIIIKDLNDQENSERHNINEIIEIELIQPKVNFLITLLSWFFDLFLSLGAGGIYKNKNYYLFIKLKDSDKKILLDKKSVPATKSFIKSLENIR